MIRTATRYVVGGNRCKVALEISGCPLNPCTCSCRAMRCPFIQRPRLKFSSSQGISQLGMHDLTISGNKFRRTMAADRMRERDTTNKLTGTGTKSNRQSRAGTTVDRLFKGMLVYSCLPNHISRRRDQSSFIDKRESNSRRDHCLNLSKFIPVRVIALHKVNTPHWLVVGTEQAS